MDIEAGNRATIRNALSTHFDVWEEVDAKCENGNIRIDVIAVAKEPDVRGVVLAFEVKKRDDEMSFTDFAKQCKQAADAVGSTLIHPDLLGKKVAAAFVFPSPIYRPTQVSAGSPMDHVVGFRNEQYLQYAGVLHLALQFRVGHARFILMKNDSVFQLAMGPNRIWNQSKGWFRDGTNLVNSFRVGSRVVTASR